MFRKGLGERLGWRKLREKLQFVKDGKVGSVLLAVQHCFARGENWSLEGTLNEVDWFLGVVRIQVQE